MKKFKHLCSRSLSEASDLLRKYNGRARAVAGGTDLLGSLKDAIHPEFPEVLVDLKTVPGLDYIEERDEGLALGALTRLKEIAAHPLIQEKYGLLAEAARTVASPQIRNMGTLAGNICQEPRCWYYRNPDNTFDCARKGGDYCNALLGDNRFHSVFGSMRVDGTPCTGACPAGIDIPEYLSLLREDRMEEAAETLLLVNPLAAVTGRVCPHFCELSCNRMNLDEAVSIRSIERFLGDYIMENEARFMKPPGKETGKTAVVIGSGPAGLSAAFFLRRQGHGVVVYDRYERVGGMLRYAIPAYRLSEEITDGLAAIWTRMGVEFRLGIEIGRDVTIKDLRREFDALFLATGAWTTPRIELEGEERAVTGLDFLRRVRQGLRQPPGQKVLVIGGGNVAVDAAITVRRLGSVQVTMACLEDFDEMPAHSWGVDQAREEGVRLMTSWGPERVRTENDCVCGLDLVCCTSVFDEEGRFAPKLDPGLKESVEADAIILAVGQRPDLSWLGGEVETTGDLIKAGPDTMATSVPGLFAGGDVTTGPATVIQAIAAGRRAAEAMNNYLGGTTGDSLTSTKILRRFYPNCLGSAPRQEDDLRPVLERRIDKEDLVGLSPEEMKTEAVRCFNCGCLAVCTSDIATALVALEGQVITTRRTIFAEDFFTARKMNSTILDIDELVREIRLPGETGRRGAYLKFRIRRSIDFPIVSAAVSLTMEGDRVKKARIVLGALAPFPYRAKAAELLLEGQRVTEAAAETAAESLVGETITLAKNGYKVQVAKVIVKRAILAAAGKAPGPVT